MNALAPISDKLAALFPRLASDADGEVVATARAIGRQLQKAGTDWHAIAELIRRPVLQEPVFTVPKPRRPETAAGVVTWLMRRLEMLRPREADFIRDLSGHTWRGASMRLSPKQERWLDAIFRRVWDIETAEAADDW